MKNRAVYNRKRGASVEEDEADSLRVADVPHLADAWVQDGRYRRLSKNTLATRKLLTDKFHWFLTDRQFEIVDKAAVRSFLAYLTTGHEEEAGRWGNEANVNRKKPIRPATAGTYFRILKTFFAFLLDEGDIDETPFEKLRPPREPKDQITPFTPDQVADLFDAARQTRHARRDVAILSLLLDTGMRAEELCDITVDDLNLTEKFVMVTGKGNKRRRIPMSVDCVRDIGAYLGRRVAGRSAGREPGQHVFLAEGGHTTGEHLTPNGLLQLFARLGVAAGIEKSQVRCSPHTCRHTFAIEFLRPKGDGSPGGNVFTLKELMGHTSIRVTERYLAIAGADMEEQHRRNSPLQSLKRKARK